MIHVRYLYAISDDGSVAWQSVQMTASALSPRTRKSLQDFGIIHFVTVETGCVNWTSVVNPRVEPLWHVISSSFPYKGWRDFPCRNNWSVSRRMAGWRSSQDSCYSLSHPWHYSNFARWGSCWPSPATGVVRS